MATSRAQSENKEVNLHKNHRQRTKEKFLKHGLKSFAEHEILELLLYFGIPQSDTNPVAHRLLNKFGSFKGVFEASYESLLSVDGIGAHTATLIKLLPEVMGVYNKSVTTNVKKISKQKEAEEYIENYFRNIQNEKFVVICLNARNEVLTCEELSAGDKNKVDVQIRLVTNAIFKNDCERVIIAHNHPHGLAKPSDEDLVVTHKLLYSCVLNDIAILDHIIYSPNGCYSFAEHKLLDEIRTDIAVLFKFDNIRYKNLCTSTEDYIVETNDKKDEN